MPKVTDPALLAQLNAPDAAAAPAPAGARKVTDPALLAQLNGTDAAPAPAPKTNPLIEAIMRSNPILSGINAGLDAFGVDKNQAAAQIGSGLPEGLLNTAHFMANAGSMGGIDTAIRGTGIDPFAMASEQLAKVTAAQPTDLAGRIERGIGNGMGGAIVPEAAIAKGPAILEQIIKSLGPAAAGGAAQGAVEQVAPNNPLAQIIASIVAGGGPSIAKFGVRAMTAPEALMADGTPVPRKATNAVKRDQIPLDQVQQKVADISPAAVVADLGDNTQKLAMGIATQPGAAGSTVVNAMRARAAQSEHRITTAANDVLGPAVSPQTLKEQVRADQKAVGPQYEQALTGASPVDATDLAKSLDEQIAVLRGKPQKLLTKARALLNKVVDPQTKAEEQAQLVKEWEASGKEGPRPKWTPPIESDPQILFNVRNAIDDMFSKKMGRNAKRVLGDARTHLSELLGEAAPGLSQTDAQYSDLAKQGDAVDTGATLLSTGKKAVWPEDLAKNRAAASAGVNQRLSQAGRAEIERIIRTKYSDRSELARMIGGETDWNRQKLEQLFPGKADAIIKVVDGERQMATTEAGAYAGTKTAAATAAQKDINSGGLTPVANVARAGGWGPMNAVMHAVGAGIDKVSGGMLEKQRQKIADAILSPGDWQAVAPQSFLSDQQKAALLAAITSGVANSVNGGSAK